MAKRILFLGSKRVGYHSLKYLIDNQEELDIEIVGVLTDPIARVDTTYNLKSLAQENGLKVYPDLEFLDEGAKSDILISVQYHRILKKSHIDYGKVAINLHMAPLPEYRGCNQFSFAILNGDQEFGTTFHILDEGIDNGDILFERAVYLPDLDDPMAGSHQDAILVARIEVVVDFYCLALDKGVVYELDDPGGLADGLEALQ